jgi:hypothetical protein
VILGFTGTQVDMTPPQVRGFIWVIQTFRITRFDHGDCLGADATAHRLVRLYAPWAHIVGHPPINPSKRAFCDVDESRPPKEYLDRNQDIVDEVGWMVATPKEFEMVLRSGTWSTVRRAWRAKRPIVILQPDGSTRPFDHPYFGQMCLTRI